MSDSEDRPAIPMEHGLRVDILDNEGIWNTGKIVDVSRDEDDMVEIKYDGWGDEYNEWIPLSSQRLAPLHMFTMVKKCWAKLTKWPWWPAFVVLRAPTRKSAADALNAESKIYVEFFDSYNEGKRSRCWMQKKNIASFQEGFDERASKNIGKNFPAYVDGTQRAMAGRSPVLFSGNGTLPIEFSSRYAKPLADAKLELAGGDEAKWFEAYRIFSAHYRVLYGYDFAKDADGSGKHATGKRASGKASGDEDDDDEVEIIGSTGKPAKRGRGRPPKGKYPKRQPPPSYADEDGDEDDGTEEKEAADDDDYEHAEEEEEEEDDGADEEPESPRGRRSARTASKRKPVHEEVDEPRRNTRPRRAKEGDEGFSDDGDDDGEDFTHYEYHGDEHGEDDDEDMDIGSQYGRGESSSRSVSPERRPLPRNTTKFNTKVHKRTALTHLLNSTQPQPVLKKAKTSKAEPEKASRVQRAEMISESMMKELEAAVTTAATGQLHLKKRSGEPATKSRRKPLHPQSLARPPAAPSSAVESTNPATAASSAVAPSAIKPDPPSRSLHHWLGFGAADEGITISGTARKPWSIQSWLISGFRRKQTSESLPTDD